MEVIKETIVRVGSLVFATTEQAEAYAHKLECDEREKRALWGGDTPIRPVGMYSPEDFLEYLRANFPDALDLIVQQNNTNLVLMGQGGAERAEDSYLRQTQDIDGVIGVYRGKPESTL